MDRDEIEKDLKKLIKDRDDTIATLHRINGAIIYLSQKQLELKKGETDESKNNNN